MAEVDLLDEDCFENDVLSALVEWRRWTRRGLRAVVCCEDGYDRLRD